MAISLASLKKTSGKAHPLTFIYGPEKVGKTTLAAEWPNPVLIRTAGENPPAEIGLPSFDNEDGTTKITDYDALMSAIEALFVEDHGFETLIADAIDGIERLVWAETCKRHGWKSLEEPGYGRGYIEADQVWGEFFDAMRALNEQKGMKIVLLGHVEIKSFDDPANGSYSRFQPNLHKRASDALKAMCDIIAFVSHRVSITKEKTGFGAEKTTAGGQGLRMIYLEARPGYVAGNRYSMPDSLQYTKGKGFAAIAKHLPAPANTSNEKEQAA
jgi:hypothetical protein